MKTPKYPSLYEVNTRVWMTQLSQALGRKATLDDIPNQELDRLAELGFDWIWFLGVWQTGEQGRLISRGNEQFRREFEETLWDLKESDIGGSCFSIAGYSVHPDLGGNEALARLRERMHARHLKLMLDFVPNHMGPDHPWVKTNPGYFVSGSQTDLERQPQNFARVGNGKSERVLAHGRDPYFDGWPDTYQLDYSNPALAEAMKQELLRISGQCDGLRCDMAMLILPEIFERTWGRKAQPFWPGSIQAVREKSPDFVFMAEVYWDLEWVMQQQGFDYAYDKRLYDRLHEGAARPVRDHLRAGLDFQDRLARFLENHDEPRAASTFDDKPHEAAAIITYLTPGLRFFHQGQFEGRKKRISPHLVRMPHEPLRTNLLQFYTRLLEVLKKSVFRNGQWSLLECQPAWEGNETHDALLAFAWDGLDGSRALIVVNFAPHQSQGYVRMHYPDLADQMVPFRDLLSTARYDRDGGELLDKGMYFNMPGWAFHVFEVGDQPKRIPGQPETIKVSQAAGK
ncbi:MAG: hypothetical protein JNN04_02865 [Cyclobacteriaceae bacterium]|nr:hypothetical protein [Cyclobacteriaceae bacterium]